MWDEWGQELEETGGDLDRRRREVAPLPAAVGGVSAKHPQEEQPKVGQGLQ